jgi:hypothetical protein
MNDELKSTISNFLNAFEMVFDKDWIHTKQRLGIVEETKEQLDDTKAFNLELLYTISPDGTFLNPKVEDETEDWGYRGSLLSEYRKLKKLL